MNTSILYNASSEVGTLLASATQNVTGDMTLTLIMLLMLVVASFMAFRLPIELILLMTLPLMILLMAYNSTFIVIGGVVLMLAGLMFAYNFIIK